MYMLETFFVTKHWALVLLLLFYFSCVVTCVSDFRTILWWDQSGHREVLFWSWRHTQSAGDGSGGNSYSLREPGHYALRPTLSWRKYYTRKWYTHTLNSHTHNFHNKDFLSCFNFLFFVIRWKDTLSDTGTGEGQVSFHWQRGKWTHMNQILIIYEK